MSLYLDKSLDMKFSHFGTFMKSSSKRPSIVLNYLSRTNTLDFEKVIFDFSI